MKLIKRLLLLLIFNPFHLTAQTGLTTKEITDWTLIPSIPNVSFMNVSARNWPGSTFTEGLSTSIIKIDNKSIISTVFVTDNQYGVIRVDKNLNTQWLTNIDGFPIAIGIFDGRILVVSAPVSSYYLFNNVVNSYTGYLIDEKTGQITTKKKIYNASDQLYEQPVFLFAPDGSFFKMAIRTSNFKKDEHIPRVWSNLNKTIGDNYFTTNDFKLFDFDNTLAVKSTTKPLLEQGYFLGGTANSNGDIFLATQYKRQLIKLAVYPHGETTAKMVLQVPLTNNEEIIANLKNSFLFTSKTTPFVVFFAATYKNSNSDQELTVSKFNFSDNTVFHSTEVMNKANFAALEKSHKPFDKNSNGPNLGFPWGIQIKNVVENNERLIVTLSSTTNVGMKVPIIISRDLLVNIYNNNVELQYQHIIPREYTSSEPDEDGVSTYCSQNTLYLVANNNHGLFGHSGFGYEALNCRIDLKSGNLISCVGIEKKNINKTYPVLPNATLWFDNQILLTYQDELSFQELYEQIRNSAKGQSKKFRNDQWQFVQY